MDTVKASRAEYWRKWYDKAKHDPVWIERRRATKRAEYQRNRAARIATIKRYASTHRETIRAIANRFYLRHAESERARSRNRPLELQRSYRRKWQRANPLKRAAIANKRRALQLSTSYGPVDYAEVIKAANGICGICQQPMNGEAAHIDHIVPLARGGSHTQDNLQLAHARCNARKGAMVLVKAG